jgi:hypothetical protein
MWLWLAAVGWAGDHDVPTVSSPTVDTWRFPWSVAHVRPAVPESTALGPDRLAADVGQVAWYHPADEAIVVARGGAIVATIRAVAVDDLAFEGGDLVVLQGRQVRRIQVDGRVVATMALPAIVPADVTLAVEDSRVLGVDVFGVGHTIALVAPDGGWVRADGEIVRRRSVRRDAGGLAVDGVHFDFSGKVSGRLVGDWLVVDHVAQAGGALTVTSEAVSLRTRRVIALPKPLMYAPSQPFATDREGHLWVLNPSVEGLVISRVNP